MWDKQINKNVNNRDKQINEESNPKVYEGLLYNREILIIFHVKKIILCLNIYQPLLFFIFMSWQIFVNN